MEGPTGRWTRCIFATAADQPPGPGASGIGRRRAGMVRSRRHDHAPLPTAGPAAVERGHARDLRRSRAPAAHARFRGGAGARRGRGRRHSGSRRRADREAACQADRYDLAALAEAATPLRQSRHPAGQGADRRGRQGRRGSRALRALGRHQPGRHRHRAGARAARRRSTRCSPTSTAPSPASPTLGATPSPHRRPWRAPGCSTRCRCRSGSSSPAMPRRWRARASGCSGCASEALVLQFGGAAGTLAALGDRGLEVAERLAAQLDLPLPEAPWHTHRDRLAEVACGVGDPRRHLRQDRARRLAADADRGRRGVRAVGPGRGGSSTMPHKRNPGRRGDRARGRDHRAESGRDHPRRAGAGARARAGGWQAEWPTFPALLLVTSGALAADRRHRRRARGRRRARMRANLDVTRRPDHGRGGVVRARRQARQERGASARRGGQQEGPRRARSTCRTCWPRMPG